MTNSTERTAFERIKDFSINRSGVLVCRGFSGHPEDIRQRLGWVIDELYTGAAFGVSGVSWPNTENGYQLKSLEAIRGSLRLFGQIIKGDDQLEQLVIKVLPTVEVLINKGDPCQSLEGQKFLVQNSKDINRRYRNARNPWFWAL